MLTPHLAGLVMASRGKDGGNRVRYNRLVDVCHPVQEIRDMWEDTLRETAENNRFYLDYVHRNQ